MEEGRTSLDERLQTMWLNHPQGCMGFRLETKDGVFVYATDNEPGDAHSTRTCANWRPVPMF